MPILNSINIKKTINIKLHVLCWIAFLFSRLVRDNSVEITEYNLLETIAFIIPTLAIFYGVGFGISQILIQRRTLLFVILVIISILFYAYLRWFLMDIWGLNYSKKTDFSQYFAINIWNGSIFSITGIGLYFAQRYYQEEQNRQQLQNELLLTELAFLKSQMNPHFLYNSLNFLYSQAISVSENLSKSILLLSEIMRYAIEESNENGKVPLEKEIKHLENFIEIHKLRFGEKLQLDYSKKVENSIEILPFMLISIVENAFKHGLVTKKGFPIKIRLGSHQNSLSFQVKNLIDTSSEKHQPNGVGLNNIRRMLALAFPDSHELEIENNGVYFEVKLKIRQ